MQRHYTTLEVPFTCSHAPKFIEAENLQPNNSDLNPVDFPVWKALQQECIVKRNGTLLIWKAFCYTLLGPMYVTNLPPKANSAFHPSGVGKWVPASAGKAMAGMVHSDSGWTRGVQVKLRDPLRTRAIPERLRGAFTTRRYTNPRLPLPYLTDTSKEVHRPYIQLQWRHHELWGTGARAPSQLPTISFLAHFGVNLTTIYPSIV